MLSVVVLKIPSYPFRTSFLTALKYMHLVTQRDRLWACVCVWASSVAIAHVSWLTPVTDPISAEGGGGPCADSATLTRLTSALRVSEDTQRVSVCWQMSCVLARRDARREPKRRGRRFFRSSGHQTRGHLYCILSAKIFGIRRWSEAPVLWAFGIFCRTVCSMCHTLQQRLNVYSSECNTKLKYNGLPCRELLPGSVERKGPRKSVDPCSSSSFYRAGWHFHIFR